MRKRQFTLSVGVLLLALCALAVTYFSNSDITGTWISKDDSKSKWVFTSDSKIKKYYNNDLLSTYTYTTTSNFPDCGIEVPNPPSDLKYLILNNTNSDKKECYTIHTLNQNYLSISRFGRGRTILFERQ